jgi:hypothetical protein
MLDNNETSETNRYLKSLFSSNNEELYTFQPCTIKKFDAEENTLSVTLDKEGIELQDVPISLLGNPNSYITTRSMEAGTKGTLAFSKHDLEDWVQDGEDEDAVTNFSLNNAIFIMGVTNHKNKVTYNMEAMELKDSKKIRLKSPKISLENDSEELFALLKALSNELKSFATTTSTHKGLKATASNASSFGVFAGKFEGFM